MLASQCFEDGELLLIFHPFGGDGKAENLGQIQDRLDDGLVLFAVHQGLNETSVELHLVRRQVAQVGERRVAGAEVIDGEQDAEILELAHAGYALQPVLQYYGFGHLQQQAGGGHACVAQYVLHLLHEPRCVKLAGADVDRQVGNGKAAVEPEAVLGAGGLHHPVSYVLDEAGLLGDGDEVSRRHHGAVAALPAQQRLYP